MRNLLILFLFIPFFTRAQYPGGMDSIHINGHDALIKIPTGTMPSGGWPMMIEVGEQTENSSNAPGDLRNLYASGSPKDLNAGKNIYFLAGNGTDSVKYIFIKWKPDNYNDVVFPGDVKNFIDAIWTLEGAIIDTSKYTDGTYRHIGFATYGRGTDAIANALLNTTVSGGCFAPVSDIGGKFRAIKKFYMSRVDNVCSYSTLPPASYSGHDKRIIKYYRSASDFTNEALMRDSIQKYSPGAYQRFAQYSLTLAQVADTMYSIRGTDSSHNIFRHLLDDPGTPPPPNYQIKPRQIFDMGGYTGSDPNKPSSWFDGFNIVDPKNGTISFGTSKADSTNGGPLKRYGSYFTAAVNGNTNYPGDQELCVYLDMVGLKSLTDTTKKVKLTDIYAYSQTYDGGYKIYIYNADKILRQPMGNRWLYESRPDSLLTPLDSITTTSTPGQWVNKTISDSCRFILLRIVTDGTKSADFTEIVFYGVHQYDTTAYPPIGNYSGPMPSIKRKDYGQVIGTDHLQGGDTNQMKFARRYRTYVAIDYFDNINSSGMPSEFNFWEAGDVGRPQLTYFKNHNMSMWYTMQGTNLYMINQGNPTMPVNTPTVDPRNPSSYTRAGHLMFNLAATYGSVNWSTSRVHWSGYSGPNGLGTMKIMEMGNELIAHGATIMAQWAFYKTVYDSIKAADSSIIVLNGGTVMPDSNMANCHKLLSEWNTPSGLLPYDYYNYHEYWSNRDHLPIGITFSYDIQIGQHSESPEAKDVIGAYEKVYRAVHKYVDTTLRMVLTENGQGNFYRPAANVDEAAAIWDIYNTPPFGSFTNLQAKAVQRGRTHLLMPFSALEWFNQYAQMNQYGDYDNNHYQLFYSNGDAAGRTSTFAYDSFYCSWHYEAGLFQQLDGWNPDSLYSYNGDTTGIIIAKYRKADSVAYAVWLSSSHGATLSSQTVTIGPIIGNLKTLRPSFTSDNMTVGSPITPSGTSLSLSTIDEQPLLLKGIEPVTIILTKYLILKRKR